jgi:hypothetical protein
MPKTDAGAPLKGENSFTEGHAKDRAVDQGFMSAAHLPPSSVATAHAANFSA